MKRADYDVRESEPYAIGQPVFALNPSTEAPIVSRLQALWALTRVVVLEAIPAGPGLPAQMESYLAHVDDIYKNDAYHSLSIVGFRVSPELIERVNSGQWNPKHNEVDWQNRDALGARGYWQALLLATSVHSRASSDPGFASGQGSQSAASRLRAAIAGDFHPHENAPFLRHYRVGGGITPAVLPHHRTCRSASGGS